LKIVKLIKALTYLGLFLTSILSSSNGVTASKPSVPAVMVARCFSRVLNSVALF